jgi:dihydropteroate synthase
MGTRAQVWGILNVTPDSFSDGGNFINPRQALAHAQAMLDAGVDVIDVGGESTRPGAAKVDLETELGRVIPIIRAISKAGVPVSIDTMHSEVALRALEAGASIINDVSGGLNDPEILNVAARSDVDIVLMHWRGQSDVMDQMAFYSDVTAEVVTSLLERKQAAITAGIREERIVLDPGFGFAKNADHNWQLLRDINEWMTLGSRILVGASRKRFLSECVADDSDGSAADRDAATNAITTYCAMHGVWAVRVHDVASAVAASKVASHLHAATKPWEIW